MSIDTVNALREYAKHRRIENATLFALACWKPEALQKIAQVGTVDPARVAYERLKAIAKPKPPNGN